MKPAKRLMTVLFSIAALLLIGSVVFDYKVGLNATRANRKMAAELGVAYRLKNFLSILKDTETGQRGYLLTGEESYLAPYREGLSEIQKELEELRQLAARGDLPKNEVEQLTQLTGQKLDELNQTVRLRADQGLEPALKIVRSDRGKEIMDQIRDQTTRLEASAHTRIETANRFAYRAARVRTATFVTTGLACLLFLGWMFRKISVEMGNREAAVREASQQKELFSKTLSSIGDGVIATDSEGRVTFMNPVAEKLTGWNQQEAFGVPLERPFKILNDATRQVVENPVTKVRQTGVVVGLANHTILVAKDGAERPIDDSAAPIRGPDGNLSGVVLVFRDVTARRAAEMTARKLAAIVEDADDAIIGKSLEGTIQSWNHGAHCIFGYTASEAIGQSIMMLVPEDKKKEELEILSRLKNGERIEHYQTVRICKDKRRIDVSLTVSPVRDSSGRIVGASKIARDITAQKETDKALYETQRQLQVHAQELETAVGTRTEELRSTVGELEAFCYSLSHDMRAPLRAIQSYAELVLENDAQKMGAASTDYLKKVIQSAVRVDRLIQDVLAYTRVSRHDIVLEPVDVERLIQDIIQERPELQKPKAEIRIEGPLPPIMGHGASLTQCISNLLENAVKFVAPGVKPQLRVYAEPVDDKVRLWFEDNGIGIDKAGQAKLFEMFQRVHGNHQYEGTGIGLAIVRKAVDRMNGEVGVESEVGKGSRFWLQLRKADE
jgi:PAS domain S-box-containing protein